MLGPATDFAAALDHYDAFRRPVEAFLQPRDVVDDGGGSGLDAAVIPIGVDPWPIVVSLTMLAFCSSTSSRSEPWLPFSART
jgi:hypothetical protein